MFDKLVDTNNYSIFLRDMSASSKDGGGVFIAVKNDFYPQGLPTFNSLTEHFWVMSKIITTIIYLCCVYVYSDAKLENNIK